MEEVQRELDATVTRQAVRFIGFDVSDGQFPCDERSGQEYVLHDAAKPFPLQYHDKFDLVHLRFLSYGIKAHQLEDFVDNVSQIIRE